MSFVIRKFDKTKPLGETLKELRKDAHITISQMAEKTKILRRYLEALEAGEYDKLPEPLYTKKFLKTYVQILGLDESYFLDRFEDECGTCDFVDQARLPRRRTSAKNFFIASKLVKSAIIAAIIIGITVYLTIQIIYIVAAPDIDIFEPKDGFVTTQATLNVSGRVQGPVSISINGLKIFLNAEGFFSEEVALERGLNLIEIEAKRRYSRVQKLHRRVILQQEPSSADAESGP